MKAASNENASPITETTEEKRLRAQRVILDSVEAAFGRRDVDIVPNLMDAAYKLLVEAYPAVLNAKTKRLIRDNYPSATEQTIKERAISDLGAYQMMHCVYTLAAITVDYNASSNWDADVESDNQLNDGFMGELSNTMQTLLSEAVRLGMTPVGAAALCITAGVRFASGNNVEFAKIMRMLVNGLEFAFSDEIRQPNLTRNERPR